MRMKTLADASLMQALAPLVYEGVRALPSLIVDYLQASPACWYTTAAFSHFWKAILSRPLRLLMKAFGFQPRFIIALIMFQLKRLGDLTNLWYNIFKYATKKGALSL